MSFEVSDAAVLEAEVRPGGMEAFVEDAVVGGELLETLLKAGVLAGDPLDGVLGPLRLDVGVIVDRRPGEGFGRI